MKKKYQTLKHLKSFEGSLNDNLERYAEIIAIKYAGTKHSYMKEYIIKVFKTLDEMGVAKYIDQKSFAKNVYNLEISTKDKMTSGIYAAAEYNAKNDTIALKSQLKFKQRIFLHEFIHMISSFCYNSSKREVEMVLPEKFKNPKLEKLFIGFKNAEIQHSIDNIVAESRLTKREDLINLIIETIGPISDMQGAIKAFKGINLEKVKMLDCQSKPYYFNPNNNEKLQLRYCNAVTAEIERFLNKITLDSKPSSLFLNPAIVITLTPTKNGDFETLVQENQADNAMVGYSRTEFNEGCTEFLAALVQAKMEKRPVLTDAYMSSVKFISCLYCIIGEKLYEGFFSNSLEIVAEALGGEEYLGMLNDIAQAFEDRKVKSVDNMRYLISSHYNINEIFIKLFKNKILEDVINNYDLFDSPEEIYDNVYACFIDYAKNIHFGMHANSTMKINEYDIYELLVKSFDEVLVSICSIGGNEESAKIIPKEVLEIFKNVEPLTDEEFIDAIKLFKEVNDIDNLFINPELQEISPVKYATGESQVVIRDLNRQDYRRNKTSHLYVKPKMRMVHGVSFEKCEIKKTKYPTSRDMITPEGNKIWLCEREQASRSKDE